MTQLTQIKQALEAVHPLAPWVILIPILMGADFLATKFRIFIWLEATYAWGSTARTCMRALPTVILGAAFDFLTTGAGDVGSIMTGAILGALVHYKPPKPPRGGGGAAVGLAALALVGCAPRSAPRVPTPTAEQAACVALAEAQKELEFRSCGANLDPPCGVNPIMDRRKAAGQACFKKGSP